jgi:competence ComEA-like helix-hairpin-helix protein
MRFAQKYRSMKSARNLTVILLLLSQNTFSFAGLAQHQEKKKPAEIALASIDINRATTGDFTKLPGIGSELARRIVAYREKHGPFRRIEDLLVIRGIGPKKWRALRPYLRIEPHS